MNEKKQDDKCYSPASANVNVVDDWCMCLV